MSKEKKLMLGWGFSDFTPYGRKVTLHGLGNLRPTTDIHDKVGATALVVENEGSSFAIVSCDLAYVPDFILKDARKILSDIDGFDPKNMIVSATHTHTSCYMERNWPAQLWGEYFYIGDQFTDDLLQPEEFAKMVTEGIAEAVKQAWYSRKPGGVSFELTYAGIAFSRRQTYKDGSTDMYGQVNRDDFNGVEEASDQGIELMFTFDEDENPTGVLANIACPAQSRELTWAVSADFVGVARDLIKEKYGLNLLTQIAPAGDQSPRDLLRRDYEKMPPLFSRDINEDSLSGMLGERFTSSIVSRLEAASSDIRWDLPVCASYTDTSLPLYKVTKKDYEEAEVMVNSFNALIKERDGELSKYEKSVYRKYAGIYNRYHLQEKSDRLPLEIVALRIGNAAFISNPFELYTIFGMRIKGRSPASQTFCVQLANGRYGYLPSKRAAAGESYGAQPYSCLAGPDSGNELVETSLDILNKMFD